MERWLGAALDYLPRWIDHQMRLSSQPGVALAAAWRGKPVMELALGKADATRGNASTCSPQGIQ